MKTVFRRYVDSSSFKMAVLFTVLLAMSAAILGYFLIDLGKRDFLRETEAAIDIEINAIAHLENNQPNLMAYIQERTKNDHLIRFRFKNAKEKLIAGTIKQPLKNIKKISTNVLMFDLNTPQGKQTFAAKIHNFKNGSRLIVARNVNQLIASYERLKYLSYLVILLMLAVVVVSFGISYFVVSRINRIASTAQTIIDTGDLSQRLLIDSRWDDISNLAQVLNIFLEKIENLMHGVREVSNNIAHDLRTPLSGLRSDIEALKGTVIDDQQIENLLTEADRILAVFQALLRITNIEKSNRSEFMSAIDLEEIMQDVAELYEPVAEEKEIKFKIEMTSGLKVKGDSDLLFQLFANILDNAIKFSPSKSVIHLYIGTGENEVIAFIEDQGFGIADHDKEQVFKHFYRSDASRTTQGNGLGLSLVRAIAEQHQAVLTLEDANPGLRVRLSFKPY